MSDVERLVERNARLVVALRHMAREVHIAGGRGHFGPFFTKCQHPMCAMVRGLVNPEDLQRAATAADDRG